MSESLKEEWFYTREGERLGPVSFAEIQQKARALELNPRLDMVWKQGMESWQPAGEIEGLFERKAPPEPEAAPASAATPTAKATPTAAASPTVKAGAAFEEESVADVMAKQEDWPGVGRGWYLFFMLLFPVLWGFVLGLVRGFLEVQLGPEIMQYVGMVAGVIPMIVLVVISIKRLLNLGMSGWWFLGNFIPLINLWVGYRCFACPAGYAFHKKLDGIGIALAILYWLMMLLVLVAVAAMVAFMLGAVNNPELQKQLGDFAAQLRQAMSKP